jgi:hypothetical protein
LRVYAFLLSLAFVVVSPRSADAYIDPGTGSYVFQALVAALLSVGFFVKSQWRRWRDALIRRKARTERDDVTPS